jgi:F-box/leucine-rich repeat protein 10/11
MQSRIQAPRFVRQHDWIDNVWPITRRARGDYPQVQKYCLAGKTDIYSSAFSSSFPS